MGISKRGDGYLRGLLIQGARNVIYHIRRRLRAGQPGGNAWVEQLLQRSHPNAVAVALANKMARIAWVLLVRNQTWCPASQSRLSAGPGKRTDEHVTEVTHRLHK